MSGQDLELISLTRSKESWRNLVNTAINCWVHKFWPSKELFGSQKDYSLWSEWMSS